MNDGSSILESICESVTNHVNHGELIVHDIQRKKTGTLPWLPRNFHFIGSHIAKPEEGESAFLEFEFREVLLNRRVRFIASERSLSKSLRSSISDAELTAIAASLLLDWLDEELTQYDHNTPEIVEFIDAEWS